MTPVCDLIEAVQASGATIEADGPDLVIKPASRVPSALKTRLRERKPELLAYLAECKPSSSATPVSDAEDSLEWIAERAAILEIDGSMDRDEANHRAFMLWYRRFVIDPGP
jgi:hypothetical protein